MFYICAMKTYKHVLLTSLFILTAFSSVLYTACTKSDKCSGVVCQNGGTCAGGTCSCPTNYTGSRCEILTDSCLVITCKNGGTCNKGTCACPTGTEGIHCDSISAIKFTKLWSANDVAGGGNNLNYTAQIFLASSTLNYTQVTIMGIANQFFTNAVSATVDHNTITIPDQEPDNNGYGITGTGIYQYGKILWSYTITQKSSSTKLVITGTWN